MHVAGLFILALKGLARERDEPHARPQRRAHVARHVARMVAALAVAIATSGSVDAAPILYGVTRAGLLYTVDTTTGAAALVGATGTGLVTEIEINPPTGTAYILHGGVGGVSLQQLDLTTATLVGSPVPLGVEFSGLEFINGTLYGTGATPSSGSTRST